MLILIKHNLRNKWCGMWERVTNCVYIKFQNLNLKQLVQIWFSKRSFSEILISIKLYMNSDTPGAKPNHTYIIHIKQKYHAYTSCIHIMHTHLYTFMHIRGHIHIHKHKHVRIFAYIHKQAYTHTYITIHNYTYMPRVCCVSTWDMPRTLLRQSLLSHNTNCSRQNASAWTWLIEFC